MEFDTIDVSLVEGGFEWFVACGGCSGGVGGAVKVAMVIMTSDGFPTPSSRSLSTEEIIFEVSSRSTEIVSHGMETACDTVPVCVQIPIAP